MNAPGEVQTYLETLRNAAPVVKWKVRCFHYEDRDVWKSWRGLGKVWEGVSSTLMKGGSEEGSNKESGDKIGGKGWGVGRSASTSQSSNVHSNAIESSSASFGETPPSWMARKVVTHQAVGTYKFCSWDDHTQASLWKRAQSFPSSNTSMQEEAPFSKLTLSKLLVLKDKNTREDYFAQQAAFVMLEGRKDVHAEFATSIEVEGFRSKLLAVRPVRRASNISAALFRQHIYVLFTLLGLSLPYRIWFAKHCDEIRVTVVKETTATPPETTSTKDGGTTGTSLEGGGKSSWFKKWGGKTSSSLASAEMDSKRAQELFRRSMQNFALYEEEPSSSLEQNATTMSQSVETTVPTKNNVQPSKPSLEMGDVSLNETKREESGDDENITIHNSQPSSTKSSENNIISSDGVTETENIHPPKNALDVAPPQDSPTSSSQFTAVTSNQIIQDSDKSK